MILIQHKLILWWYGELNQELCTFKLSVLPTTPCPPSPMMNHYKLENGLNVSVSQLSKFSGCTKLLHRKCSALAEWVWCEAREKYKKIWWIPRNVGIDVRQSCLTLSQGMVFHFNDPLNVEYTTRFVTLLGNALCSISLWH